MAEKDIYDRLLEFIGNARLEQYGIPGQVRSVPRETPKEAAARTGGGREGELAG